MFPEFWLAISRLKLRTVEKCSCNMLKLKIPIDWNLMILMILVIALTVFKPE